jgi:DNA-binding response OmpR family regulator
MLHRQCTRALENGMNAPTGAAVTRQGTIVIAEDDEATRMLLCAVLTRANFSVRAFENGALACADIERERPDVVLLDWMMPVMDGCSAVTRLKSDVQTRGIPIVMLTTQSQIEERVIALEAGVQDFLTKPFDPRELVARIEQQLRWRKLLAVDANEGFAAERLQLYRGYAQRAEPPANGPTVFDRIWGDDKKPKFRGLR